MEPPDIAFPKKSDVDANYIRCMETYLTTDSEAYLCIATHDEQMIQAAEDLIQRHHISSDRYEFQMLYGIRSDRQQELAQQHTMRVYVPFGEAWYPYFMRRLAERPANLWFFLSNLFN
jgi:proline dehydrogenase